MSGTTSSAEMTVAVEIIPDETESDACVCEEEEDEDTTGEEEEEGETSDDGGRRRLGRRRLTEETCDCAAEADYP